MLSHCSDMLWQIWSAMSSSELPYPRQTCTYWTEASDGPQRVDWNNFHNKENMRRLRSDTYLMERGSKEGSGRFFLVTGQEVLESQSLEVLKTQQYIGLSRATELDYFQIIHATSAALVIYY